VIDRKPRIACVRLISLWALCTLLSCTTAATPTVQPRPTAAVTTTSAGEHIRQPAVAGAFYPAETAQLEQMVDDLLKHSTLLPQEPIALIVPHAGYVFSGGVAASAFRQLEGRRYEAVVVLGTNHGVPEFHKIAVWPDGGYSTPLGVLPVDSESAQLILAADPDHIVVDRSVQLTEHSIEVELPFLLQLFGPQAFVPIMIGEPSWENCRALSATLVKVFQGRKVLIVASSDLSHYPRYEDAVAVDSSSLLAISSLDPEAVIANTSSWMRYGVPNLACTMCGEGPVLTAMMAAQGLGANRASILQYANSGDSAYGDRSQVVGYGAVMFWRGESAALDSSAQAELLSLARRTLQEYLGTGVSTEHAEVSMALVEPSGAFVTLKLHGQVRGCIGTLWASEPLGETVQRMAVAAASRDSRFTPVTGEELSQIDIEISVLSPMRYIRDVGEIEVGRDGIYITQGPQSGVLLPQVATEQGWDRDEFLRQVCYKAGLPSEAWQQGAMLYRFEAQVFGEDG
jgi:AmmeMemoRadiSam system protein B/AmmeMemoRadiSam system protein A